MRIALLLSGLIIPSFAFAQSRPAAGPAAGTAETVSPQPAVERQPSIEEEQRRIDDEERQLDARKRQLRRERARLESPSARRERKRWHGPPLWANLGPNIADGDDSLEACGGGQTGFTMLGGPLLVRLQYSFMTLQETAPHRNNCSGGSAYLGDTTLNEYAALGGVMLGRTGIFVAAGPARVNIWHGSPARAPKQSDTGTRFELGWSARRTEFWDFPVGVEPVLFKVNNDVRDYWGLAINVTIGPR